MPNQTSVCITLSERVRALVQALARQRRAAYRQVQRAEFLLALADGGGNNALARSHNVDRGVVRKWRTRWVERARKLAHAETTAVTDTQLGELLVADLQDLPRSGAPATFSAEQIVQVSARSGENPPASGRPVTDWTPPELAAEVVKRGIAPRLSPTPVGRFLKSARPCSAAHRGLAQRAAPGYAGVRRASQNGVRGVRSRAATARARHPRHQYG